MTAPVPIPSPTLAQSLAGIADKVGWSFLQALIAYLLLHNVLDASTATAAALAGVAAGVNTLIALSPSSLGGNPYVDVLYRMIRTFGIVFVTPLIASGVLSLDFALWKASLPAAFAALLAVAKGFVGTKVGDKSTAAILPLRLDPAIPSALPQAA